MQCTQHRQKIDINKHRPSPEEQLVVFRIEDPRIPFVPRNRQQGDNCLKLEGKMVTFLTLWDFVMACHVLFLFVKNLWKTKKMLTAAKIKQQVGILRLFLNNRYCLCLPLNYRRFCMILNMGQIGFKFALVCLELVLTTRRSSHSTG